MTRIAKACERHHGTVLVLIGLVGGTFGLAFGPRKAKACSCDGWDNWSLTVESVTSGDNVDHSAAWPTSAKINDLPRQVDFWATSGTGDGVTHVQVYR